MGKEIQRTLLWVILLGSLFLLWDNYQVYRGGTSFFASTEATQQASDGASVPADGVPTSEAAVGQETSEAQVVGNKAIYASGRTVEVVTDRLKVTFDLKGAKIVGAELTQIPRQASWTEVGLAGLILGRKPSENLGNVRLLEANDQRIYTAQSGLIGGNFPNHSDEFKLISKDLSMGDKDRLSVSFEAVKGGVRVVKTYSFSRNRYGIQLDTQIINESAQTVSPQIYYQIIRDDGKPEEEATNYSTFTGPAVYTSEDKFQKIPFEDIADQDASFAEKADNGWIAMVQHHFVSAWIPTQGEERQNYVRSLGDHVFALGSIVPLKTLATGQSEKTEALFYVGPQSQQRLEELAPGLELVVDYGWLTFLAKPIYWLLSFLHNLVGNWGWSIVLLTCIVKAILYPISAAGYRSMARMKELTPRIKNLQDKYKDDKQRLNQAMMELYRSEKINPVGGCLPIFLQIPVFLALYWVLQGSVELRGSEWILWVHDLAMPDPWFVLPTLMAATMFLQVFLNPKPADPVQAKVTYIMPIVFSVMFFVFASGLVLYWLTNNILSIIQQWWINKTIAQWKNAKN